jgi:hypothetical protein
MLRRARKLVLPVPPVRQDRPDQQVTPDRSALQDQRDRPGLQGLPGRQDLPDQREQLGRRDLPDQREQLDRRDQPDRLGLPGLPDQPDPQVRRDPQVQPDQPDRTSSCSVAEARPSLRTAVKGTSAWVSRTQAQQSRDSLWLLPKPSRPCIATHRVRCRQLLRPASWS